MNNKTYYICIILKMHYNNGYEIKNIILHYSLIKYTGLMKDYVEFFLNNK
jgi:hypothetical protein